jgi:uncharacterized protein YvpB
VPARKAAGASPAVEPAAQSTKPESDRVALSSGVSARNLLDFRPFLQNQNANGTTNGCGTTSLAMVLSAWQNQPGAYTRETIDASIRRFNAPTSPQNIVDFAQQQGFRAVAQNNGSVDNLKRFIDQGVPVQIMYDPDGNGADSTLHYVVVTDYQADATGNVTSLVLADPWGGKMKTVPVDEFKRRWDDLGMMGRSTGLNNLMVPMVPRENTPIVGKDGQIRQSKDIELPEGGNLGWRMAIGDAAFDVSNGASKAIDALASVPGKAWKAMTSL